MRLALSNNRAGLHKEVGLLALLFIAGCTVIEIPAPKRWDCTHPDDNGKWACHSLHSNRVIACEEM